MKKLKVLISLFLASISLGALASCDLADKYLKSDSDTSIETPEVDPWAEYETITIAQALELCGEEGNVTTERYYIRAIVVSVTNPEYGAMVIEDETGSISVYNTAGYKDMAEKPYKGDEVLLSCILKNHNGTKEINAATLIDFKSNAGNVDENGYAEMSIAQAREKEDGAKVYNTLNFDNN